MSERQRSSVPARPAKLREPECSKNHGLSAHVRHRSGERRFLLANQVDLHVRTSDGEVYFEVEMQDAWVWDMYRPARFVKNVRVMTFKDVNVEELEKPDISLPTDTGFGS
jgi:hypothetical protein